MKAKSILLILLFATLSVMVKGQSITIRFDLTKLENANAESYLSDNMEAVSIYNEKSISIETAHLPILVELKVLKNHKFTTKRLIWVEDPLIRLEGTIDAPELISISPKNKLQVTTDLLANDIIDRKELEGEKAYSKPYLVFLAGNLFFQKTEYLHKIQKNMPDELKGFWATQAIDQYLSELDNVGYDASSQKVSHLTAMNSSKELVKIDFVGTKYTLIDFSSSGCAPCIKGIDELLPIYEKEKDRLEIVMLWDDREYDTWMRVAKQQKDKITWVSLVDQNGSIFKAFNIRSYPTYMLVDNNGAVVKKWNKVPKNIEKYLPE